MFKPDKVTAGVNLGFVKVEAEWNRETRAVPLGELKRLRSETLVKLASASRRRDTLERKTLKEQLKTIDEELSRVELFRD
jgi:hypothetical protein